MSSENRREGLSNAAGVKADIINRDDSYVTTKELAMDAEKQQQITRTKLEWEMAINAERKRMKADKQLRQEKHEQSRKNEIFERT